MAFPNGFNDPNGGGFNQFDEHPEMGSNRTSPNPGTPVTLPGSPVPLFPVAGSPMPNFPPHNHGNSENIMHAQVIHPDNREVDLAEQENKPPLPHNDHDRFRFLPIQEEQIEQNPNQNHNQNPNFLGHYFQGD